MTSLSVIKMSAKLIVRRFENETNFQTLDIIIEENDVSQPKFGTWHNGKDELKKKVSEKPRLVVKIVAGESSYTLNLDSCAQSIDNAENYSKDFFNTNNRNISDNIKDSSQNRLSHICDFECKNCGKNEATPYKVKNVCRTPQFNAKIYELDINDVNSINLLENSLEKVKKNNARIMENIHMLNRTLNYTKKKEILDTINPKPLGSYPCSSCGKCFVYETGLLRHYSMRHANLESPPRWQLVWTCTECFQVWPKQDVAFKHADQCKPNNPDCVREIKTSSLLQCEFCEKVFTCIPRLLRHAKMHSVINNYECNACDIAFSCYKTAEQHWVSCVWLKMCYQFSLPKLLLCNACDRKFRNYDQLYNHRYKFGHFIPKTSDETNCAYIPTLVYQCEICGQWFIAIMQLQVHRSQFHPQLENGILNKSDVPALIEAPQKLEENNV